ncbi:hypothetical protein ASPSYDRAFT_92764 [Aspergillus sydowii CBS 593.65]|uniref:Alcohol dehydrogenase-like C-terminal domain-containing protein n=1 Tax=Aspergillus sydowii CBS 593.65 TaxID=1036612 RepID=A0A1L9T888_9EURO|nr:uncharacterized protein ASPSYDRAFT_92764 [Aspergillus sydowii CBS 593.65]OJJ55637.1 hypothetical protein ASPSYDRAFT_92764 [Aspergillus sydowii CBS 593.65]
MKAPSSTPAREKSQPKSAKTLHPSPNRRNNQAPLRLNLRHRPTAGGCWAGGDGCGADGEVVYAGAESGFPCCGPGFWPGCDPETPGIDQGDGFDSVRRRLRSVRSWWLREGGMHGTKVDLHLKTPWDPNISIRMPLVNTTTTPQLLRLVEPGMLDIGSLVTHHFLYTEGDTAYATFQEAAQDQALKVAIDFE